MKTKRFFTVLLALVIVTAGLSAQSADDVINDYLSAIGGKKKLEKIKSLEMKSAMSSDMFEATAVTTILNGKGSKMEMDVMGYQSVTCYTDKEGWRTDPMSGSTDLIPENEYKLGKGQIYVSGGLERYEELGLSIEMIGRAIVNGVNAYQIRSTIVGSDRSSDSFFDPDTHLLIRTVMIVDSQGSDMEMVVDYKDYKEVEGGIKLSHMQTYDFGGQLVMDNSITSVEVNIPVDEAIFERE